MTVPLPPKVGDVYYHRSPVMRGPYHVRAVVDVEQHKIYGWLYHVVLRYWSPRKGWRYLVEHAFAFSSETPLYSKKARKRA